MASGNLNAVLGSMPDDIEKAGNHFRTKILHVIVRKKQIELSIKHAFNYDLEQYYCIL